jgi:DNA helicase-2/ATP-dependent DNA helicase PcrA
MEHLLEHLNEEQVRAVTHRDGPLMIIAGAGTGKTTVITHRIGWLIEQKIAKPENILALTFTERAAGEMEERVDILLPYGYVDLQISTFHAFCERVLRDWGAEIGLSRNFQLVNELDAWLLMRQHLDRFDLDYYRPLGNPTKHLKTLLSHFSRAKDECITPEAYLAHAEQQLANLDTAQADASTSMEGKCLTEVARAYHTYQQILHEHDAVDFGDLILLTLHLLRDRPRALEALREQFTHILVDEFQDTNLAQYALVKLLCAPKNNLTVVGDDDQSIYKFRGASLSNILQFEKDFSSCERVVLTKNYRSGQAILDLAHALIQHNNPNRLEGRQLPSREALSKHLTSQRDHRGSVHHLHYETMEDEARGVAEKILSLRTEHPDASWSDMGILVRANHAARAFVLALECSGIPYQFHALRGLYAKPVILDWLSALRILDNPYHSPSLYRALCHPTVALDPSGLLALTFAARKKGKTLYEIAMRPRAVPGLDEQTAFRVETFFSKIAKLTQETKTRSASEMMILVGKELGYLDAVNHLPDARVQEDFRFLRQFYERVKRFEARNEHRGLHAFLEEFELEQNAGEEGALSSDREAGPDLVRLMTVHGSKGLEFRFVFVVNLVDRRFPTQERREALELPDALVQEIIPEGDLHLEEERRLFYVAMTRAKDGLFFTSADDYGGERKKKPSRFLSELGITPSSTDGEASTGDPFGGTTVTTPRATATVTYTLPKQFSFTQLRAFQTCPLQYTFAHILKIPVFESWSLSFGKTMHLTLQEWFRRWIERVGKAQQDLFGANQGWPAASPVPLDEVFQIFVEKWIDDWYPNDRMREEYRAQGKASLKTYHAMLAANPPRPFALECGFTCKIGPVIIKGRIDRVDEVDGGVEIIDYKTGSPRRTLEFDDKQQLLLYQVATEEALHLKPVQLTYHYVTDHSELSFLGTPNEVATLKENILDTVNRMKKNRFEPTPGRWCQHCDFRDICEFREPI